MYLDITEMQTFYASRLGRVTQRLLNKQISTLWPDRDTRPLVGFGYVSPFMGGHPRSVQIMPARQGVAHWPKKTGPKTTANRTTLAPDNHLPLADNSVDRLLVCHALENTNNVRRFVREIWRVLAPESRMLMIVPHRRSLWPLSERTPFGQGRPFSTGQLETLLKDHLFEPTGTDGALYGWPGQGRFAVRLLGLAEAVGCRLWPGASGVILAEAKKAMMAPVNGGLAAETVVLEENHSVVRRESTEQLTLL